MSSVLTGLEGLITPEQIREEQLKRGAAQFAQANKLKSGVDFAGRVAGIGIGRIIARALGPTERKRRAELGEQIVQDARAQVDENQTFEGDLAGFDRRIAVVNNAIKGFTDQGMTREADQLRANAVSLTNQRTAQRIELNKEKGQIARTADTIQTTAFNILGDPAVITFPGQPDPITVMQRPDGSVQFTDPSTGLQKELQPGEYTTVSIQGGVDDISPDKVAIRNGVKKMNAMHGMLTIGMQMRQAIVDDPRSTTFAAPVAAALNSAAVNARAFVQDEFGRNVDISNRSRVERVLARMGVKQGVMKSRASQISFAIATSREGGRLTDQDIERAAEAAGFGISDPAVRIAVLDALLLDTQSEFDFLGKNPAINSLPQFEALSETFASFENARRDFSVVIPGREGETGTGAARIVKKSDAIFSDERGSIF